MNTTNKENVQNWRKRTKDRIVRAFGSKCVCCGYNRSQEALQFHHLDPTTKETTISSLTSNIKGWSKIVDEARKCVMVCSNCHSEIHSGIRSVPDNPQMFDESFAEYRKVDFGDQSICLVCNKSIPDNQSTCSYSCASKKSGSIVWDDDALTLSFKNKESLASIAKILGVSGSAVGKRLKKLGLK